MATVALRTSSLAAAETPPQDNASIALPTATGRSPALAQAPRVRQDYIRLVAGKQGWAPFRGMARPTRNLRRYLDFVGDQYGNEIGQECHAMSQRLSQVETWLKRYTAVLAVDALTFFCPVLGALARWRGACAIAQRLHRGETVLLPSGWLGPWGHIVLVEFIPQPRLRDSEALTLTLRIYNSGEDGGHHRKCPNLGLDHAETMLQIEGVRWGSGNRNLNLGTLFRLLYRDITNAFRPHQADRFYRRLKKLGQVSNRQTRGQKRQTASDCMSEFLMSYLYQTMSPPAYKAFKAQFCDALASQSQGEAAARLSEKAQSARCGASFARANQALVAHVRLWPVNNGRLDHNDLFGLARQLKKRRSDGQLPAVLYQTPNETFEIAYVKNRMLYAESVTYRSRPCFRVLMNFGDQDVVRKAFAREGLVLVKARKTPQLSRWRPFRKAQQSAT